MARNFLKKFTDSYIQSIKPTDKEQLFADRDNLYLLVKPNGAKFWRFIYTHPINKKRVKKSFGAYPYFSLTLAREKARKWCDLLALGIDPSEQENIQRLQDEKKSITFGELAALWRNKREQKGELKKKSIEKAYRRVELHLFDKFKFDDLPIENLHIKSFDSALLPLDGSDTCDKLCTAIRQIFDNAIDDGIINNNPFARLSRRFKKPIAQHLPTIPPEELPRVFYKLNTSNSKIGTKCLIEFQLLTILRASEAVNIEWGDVDWHEKVLHIPAERMKGGKRAHSVPLSRQALRVLETMKEINGHRRFVFTGYQAPWNKPMNSQTVNKTLIDLGFKGELVGHGFRSIASTYLHELDQFSYEAVEWCLSHETKSDVRKAYDKSKKWKPRQAIMQCWGDYVEQCKFEAMKA
ncbi:tyrosine-type recombinase/integrase [Rodentibacter pneumotropicus]|uniref:tyrosine-type recombinase/integrase n=1 Tax=Rodentibacter pneumotropicus TaxID=758 RepID=UPI00232B1E3A|nr:tyrosine-type recombinase/integrase [Rodentibacter pneumotropicus]MDC2825480.1 tyrosine-type recombinase/integrase [Rodentibacter pneumotropicus]